MSYLLDPSQSPSIAKSKRSSMSRSRNFGSKIGYDIKYKILKQCEPVLEAYSKTLEIWEALKVSNYKKEGVLNRIAVDIFFNSQSQNLYDLLAVKSCDELIDLIDQDQDGSLGQDEQISIFFMIKTRMQKCANELCNIHEYDLYEKLLSDIQKLEKDIMTYQNTLRVDMNQIDRDQLLVSQGIKEKEFEEKWQAAFDELKNEKKIALCEIRKKHEKEDEELRHKVMMDSNLKIKPTPLIKALQNQEKLVAIDEKILEAKKIRKELKKIESSEAARIEFEIVSLNANKFKKLELRHKAEMNHLHLQHEKKKINLIQKCEAEKNQMVKVNHIKMNRFVKNQELSSLIAEKNVRKKENIAKMKEKSLKKRMIIKNSKTTDQSLQASQSFSMNMNETVKTGNSQSSFLRGIRKDNWLDKSKFPSFYINSKSIDKSLSAIIVKNTEILNHTLKRIQEFDQKQSMTSLCALYDKHLNTTATYL